MRYESLMNVEWLDKPTEMFEYKGYHFQGVGTLRNSDFHKVSRMIRHESRESDAIGLWNKGLYEDEKSGRIAKGWDYKEFYSVAKTEGFGNVDIFRCIENDVLYIPGTNEMFRYD